MIFYNNITVNECENEFIVSLNSDLVQKIKIVNSKEFF